MLTLPKDDLKSWEDESKETENLQSYVYFSENNFGERNLVWFCASYLAIDKSLLLFIL